MRIALHRHTRNVKENRLRDAGYVFSGFYTSESKDLAKQKAAEYRAKGYYATVLTKTYQGRVYNTVGYSVYIKERAPTAGAGEPATDPVH
jgi:hypothetical protein